MATLNDIDLIHQKLQELRVLIDNNGGAAEHLDETIRLTESIAPFISDLNTSLIESTKRIPGAAMQLSDVTRATELATIEILDTVDKALRRCSYLLQHADSTRRRIEILYKIQTTLRGEIQHELNEQNPRMIMLLERLWQQQDVLEGLLHTNIDEQKREVEDLKNRLNQITMSLQVQDITTQQIASVNHVIDSVNTLLHDLVARGIGLAEATADAALDSGSTFDADARYDHQRSSSRQNDADAFIQHFLDGKTSPDDIDRMFGSNTD